LLSEAPTLFKVFQTILCKDTEPESCQRIGKSNGTIDTPAHQTGRASQESYSVFEVNGSEKITKKQAILLNTYNHAAAAL